jgi:arabinan endo-1,5-alpha-L-arabinosidase
VPGEEYRISVVSIIANHDPPHPKANANVRLQCRSESPTGNFKDKEGKDCATENGGTLVLASHGDVYAPGGQGVFWDPQSSSVILYYHYVKRSVGYEYRNFWFGHNKLSFEGGWPRIVS